MRDVLYLLAALSGIAHGQQGEWEDWFFFGTDQGFGSDATRAVNLVHVWNGSTTKVLALSADLLPL